MIKAEGVLTKAVNILQFISNWTNHCNKQWQKYKCGEIANKEFYIAEKLGELATNLFTVFTGLCLNYTSSHCKLYCVYSLLIFCYEVCWLAIWPCI